MPFDAEKRADRLEYSEFENRLLTHYKVPKYIFGGDLCKLGGTGKFSNIFFS
jgi:hypothetical protein